ncbi:NAD(P)H-binding protein [Streptomyces sp. NPDC094448]|uniref:NAD(P)H-binding protein n=1 Tax=Streptomyces sp. NPDC094448 TaxID=3366063 RepID=UPI0038065146
MISIVGATGHTGRALVSLLENRQVPQRLLVRDTAAAGHLLGTHHDLRRIDTADPAGITATLDGSHALFLLMGNSPEQFIWERNIVQAAVRARVPRIVKVSGFSPAPESPGGVDRVHAAVEEYITASGLAYCFLRPSLAMYDIALLHGPGIRRHSVLSTALTGPVAFLDSRDLAAAAATALTQDGHEYTRYRITGPQAFTPAETAALLTTATGRRIIAARCSEEEEQHALQACGLPTFLTDHIQALFREINTGTVGEATSDYEKLTGLTPRTLHSYLAEHHTDFQPTST